MSLGEAAHKWVALICSYWCSTTAATAAAISSRTAGETRPIFSINRWRSAQRTCSASAAEVLVRPLRESGSMRMCQKFRANASSQPVIGTMSFSGSFPTASELITTAGLVFLISEPRVGSKFTRQISPRLGPAGWALKRSPSSQRFSRNSSTFSQLLRLRACDVAPTVASSMPVSR